MNALEDKKGEDILLLDIQDLASFTDYFIICTGTSGRMLTALAEDLIEKMRNELKRKGRIEGRSDSGWLVVDYGDVVIHLFTKDVRRYYQLEELWKEGKFLLRVQ